MSQPHRPADWRGEIAYTQPGLLSTLPYNKVAQFGLGVVVIMVAWRAYWSGWFSTFAFTSMDQSLPPEGMGTPFGLLPFLIDAVCLVGLGGFALLAMGRSVIGPVLAGLPEWFARLRGEDAATAAATEAATGIRTSNGRELTLAEANKYIIERIKRLEAKTAGIEPPPEPDPPKTSEEMLAEQTAMIARMQARLDELDAKSDKPATTRTTRAKS